MLIHIGKQLASISESSQRVCRRIFVTAHARPQQVMERSASRSFVTHDRSFVELCARAIGA
jgi:hypothetical protein